MYRPESQPEGDFGDGVQPEDIARLKNESDPSQSRKDLEAWEEHEFGNKGDSIDEEDPVHFV